MRTPHPIPKTYVHSRIIHKCTRYPFLLVDKVVEFDAGKRAVGIKQVRIAFLGGGLYACIDDV